MEKTAVKIVIFDSSFHCTTTDVTVTLADAIAVLVNCLDDENFCFGTVLSQDWEMEYARVCGKAFPKRVNEYCGKD